MSSNKNWQVLMTLKQVAWSKELASQARKANKSIPGKA